MLQTNQSSVNFLAICFIPVFLSLLEGNLELGGTPPPPEGTWIKKCVSRRHDDEFLRRIGRRLRTLSDDVILRLSITNHQSARWRCLGQQLTSQSSPTETGAITRTVGNLPHGPTTCTGRLYEAQAITQPQIMI